MFPLCGLLTEFTIERSLIRTSSDLVAILLIFAFWFFLDLGGGIIWKIIDFLDFWVRVWAWVWVCAWVCAWLWAWLWVWAWVWSGCFFYLEINYTFTLQRVWWGISLIFIGFLLDLVQNCINSKKISRGFGKEFAWFTIDSLSTWQGFDWFLKDVVKTLINFKMISYWFRMLLIDFYRVW